MATNNSSTAVLMLLSQSELEFFNIILPIISLVGLFINLIVGYVILTDREMRQTAASIYIVNLAFADILVLVVGVPLWIFQLVSQNSSAWSCQLTFGLSYVTSFVSLITLAIIGYDRYRCVTRPYSIESGKKHAIKMVAIVWFVGTILSVPFFAGWQANHHIVTFQTSAFCVYTRVFRREAMSIGLFVFAALVILSTYFYMKLLAVARRQATLIEKDMKIAQLYQKESKIKAVKKLKLLKATKTLGVILGAMIICWMPILVLSTIDIIDTTKISVFILKFLGTITYLNSILNPIIYTFMTRAFKESLTRRLYRVKSKLFVTTKRQKKMSFASKMQFRSTAYSITSSTLNTPFSL